MRNGGSLVIEGRTVEASIFVRHATSACHILHSPQVHTAIAAPAGNTLAVLACSAACDVAPCKSMNKTIIQQYSVLFWALCTIVSGLSANDQLVVVRQMALVLCKALAQGGT